MICYDRIGVFEGIDVNANKPGFFESSFFWRAREVAVNLTLPFILQEQLIYYQYNFTKLLNSLFRVGLQ